jgi:hypothetical protein
MGYGGGQTDITNQITAQQGVLDRLKAQGVGTPKIGDYVNKMWLDANGDIIPQQTASQNRTKDNPIYQEFLNQTGGSYGKGDGYNNWLKDAYARSIGPAQETLKKALQVSKGNEAVYNQQMAAEQQKLDQLKNIQTQVGASGGTANPMLSYLEHGPNQANYISQQVTDQYNNANRLQDAQLAARGMGSSSMSEIGGANNANMLAQGILGAQVAGATNNYNDRLKMLQFLQGNKAQANQQENSQMGLYNQQMGMGQGVAQNQASALDSKNAAQIGLNLQTNQANLNASQANQAQQNNAWGSVGSAMGNYSSNNAMKNWLNGQNSMNQTYGSSYSTGNPNNAVTGNFGTNGAWASSYTPPAGG